MANYFNAKIYEYMPLLANDNHTRAELCEIPQEYHCSSARFYQDGTNDFGMLKYLFPSRVYALSLGAGHDAATDITNLQ